MSAQTKRELLELAVNALGLPYVKPAPEYDGRFGLEVGSDNPFRAWTWNPIDYDSDAFRLAAKLRIEIVYADGKCICQFRIPGKGLTYVSEQITGDSPYAAIRLAIVRAAAEIALAKAAAEVAIAKATAEIAAEKAAGNV